jgi:hypothetical protein
LFTTKWKVKWGIFHHPSSGWRNKNLHFQPKQITNITILLVKYWMIQRQHGNVETKLLCNQFETPVLWATFKHVSFSVWTTSFTRVVMNNRISNIY